MNPEIDKAEQEAFPQKLLPDMGATIRCSRCIKADFEIPELDFREAKTVGEQFALAWRNAESKGWAYTTRDSEDGPEALFICPSCIQVDKVKLEQKLPIYDAHGRCSKCAHEKLGTKYCNGRANCSFGAPREHIHRICRLCGFTWTEGCLDDPKTTKRSMHALQHSE